MTDASGKWMEQSSYEGIPSSEVNWAQLAQNWITMQSARAGEGNGEGLPVVPPPPPPMPRGVHRMPLVPPNSQFIPPMPFFPPVPIVSEAAGFPGPPAGWAPPAPGSFPHAAGPFPPFLPPHGPWMNNSNIPVRPPGPNTSQPYVKAEAEEEEEGGEYSHYYKEWDEKQKMEQQRYDGDGEEVGGIPQGAMAHWMAPTNHWGPSSNWMRRGGAHEGGNADAPYIDQQTRKTLPAWIREGLEKAEREKQKKLAKEMKMRIAEEAAKNRRLSKGLGKFDSDTSDDDAEPESNEKSSNGFKDDGEPIFLANKASASNHFDHKVEDHHVKEEDDVDTRSDDEKREDALLLLRRFLTEVLLMTTDGELNRIVGEVIENEKRKNAQPKILAKSSALAALSFLGTGSDEETDDEEKGNQGAEGDDERTPSPATATAAGSENSQNFFKTPLPLRQTAGAKSKAKLSRNDDGNSATLVPKDDATAVPEEGMMSADLPSESGSTHLLPKESGADTAALDSRSRSSKKGKEHESELKRPRGRSNERRSASPKRYKSSRGRSRSRERKSRDNRRSRSLSKPSNESPSSNSRSRSRTPERYRRVSGSSERKRHSHHSYRERSRSREKHVRRSSGRARSRSREKRSKSREDRRSRSRGRHRRHSHRSRS